MNHLQKKSHEEKKKRYYWTLTLPCHDNSLNQDLIQLLSMRSSRNMSCWLVKPLWGSERGRENEWVEWNRSRVLLRVGEIQLPLHTQAHNEGKMVVSMLTLRQAVQHSCTGGVIVTISALRFSCLLPPKSFLQCLFAQIYACNKIVTVRFSPETGDCSWKPKWGDKAVIMTAG